MVWTIYCEISQTDDPMSRKRLILSLVAAAVIAGAIYAAWALLLRPVTVQVAHAERDVAVQVFGLGTGRCRRSHRERRGAGAA